MHKVEFFVGCTSIIYSIGLLLTSFPTRRLFEAALIRRLYTIKATSFGGIMKKAKLESGGIIEREFGDPIQVPYEYKPEIS